MRVEPVMEIQRGRVVHSTTSRGSRIFGSSSVGRLKLTQNDRLFSALRQMRSHQSVLPR